MQRISVFLRTALALAGLAFVAHPFAAAQSAMDQFNSVYGSKSSAAGPQGPASSGTAISMEQVQKVGRKLDILGVYPGMPVKAAIGAIHAHNPAFTPTPESFKMSDVLDQTFTSHIHFRSPPEPNSGGVSPEIMDIQLTMQPMQPYVVQVVRNIQYNDSNNPTLTTTIAALRTKYGHESDSTPADPTHTDKFYWYYDENGQQVTGAAAKTLTAGACSYDADMKSSIVNGFDGQGSCAHYNYLVVEVHEVYPGSKNRLGQLMPPGLVRGMDLKAESIPLHVESAAATRKMLFAAREGRQQQEKKAAGKNKPVL
jgi:hypothetical protein